MPTNIPSNLNEKAVMEVCVLGGIEVDYAIEILSKSAETFDEEVKSLGSSDCKKTVEQIKQTLTVKEVQNIRRAERKVHRGPVIKKLIYEATLRQMYLIALRATSS